jgi:TonB family protein
VGDRRVWIFLCLLILVETRVLAQLPEPRPLPDNPLPEYPAIALADAVIGFAEVEIKVNPDGGSESIRIVNVKPPGFGFEEAAKAAASRWRFEREATAQTGGARTFTARFEFSPTLPVPIAGWQPSKTAKLAFPESGKFLKLEKGWIRTRRWFSDFAMDLEFRLLEPRTFAGLLLYAQPVGRIDDRVAYRVNLTDEGRGRAAVGRIDGRGLKFREASFDQALSAASVTPTGDWLRLRVESVNGTARVFLNGALISISDQFERRAGHIGLEVMRGAIEVRKTSVERLDKFYAASAARPGGAPVRADVKTPGLSTPVLHMEVKPDYPVHAMQQMKEGVVELEAVVLPDGSVGPVHVTRSLDLDLDQAAVAAVRRWKFGPGRLNGRPVAVLVNVELTFRLK